MFSYKLWLVMVWMQIQRSIDIPITLHFMKHLKYVAGFSVYRFITKIKLVPRGTLTWKAMSWSPEMLYQQRLSIAGVTLQDKLILTLTAEFIISVPGHFSLFANGAFWVNKMFVCRHLWLFKKVKMSNVAVGPETFVMRRRSISTHFKTLNILWVDSSQFCSVYVACKEEWSCRWFIYCITHYIQTRVLLRINL